MKHMDLFSGIGGFALACEWAGIETIGFCEMDKFCQRVLKKHWPNVEIVEDVNDLSGWVLGENEGICYNKICETIDSDKQIFQTLNELDKRKLIGELISSARIAGQRCTYLQAWLKQVGDFVPEYADIPICAEATHQIPMEGCGCEEMETLIGKVDTDTNDKIGRAHV